MSAKTYAQIFVLFFTIVTTLGLFVSYYQNTPDFFIKVILFDMVFGIGLLAFGIVHYDRDSK